MLIVDYSFIELVTLAAVCLFRYGRSRLAEVIMAGIDPHANTAAVLNSMTLEQFEVLKRTDPQKYKSLRQKAKPINFGLPGGMGPSALVEYARSVYGVEMSAGDAEQFRRKVVGEIYPELAQYLADDSMAVLAENLGCRTDDLWAALDSWGDRPGWLPTIVRRIVSGEVLKKDGTRYKLSFLNAVWSGLVRLCGRPDLRPSLEARLASEALAERLFRRTSVTLTGRVWSGVDYTQARNSQFQGLAGCGAKLGLFELARRGFQIVAFVHDEVVIEVPEPNADAAKTEVAEILKASMAAVLGAELPVKVEATLEPGWKK